MNAEDSWSLCRLMRRQAGLTQRELARRAKTSPATVARIEKGRMHPTVELLRRLAHAAGFELQMTLVELDADERKARALARALTDEERLRQNDSLSALWVAAYTPLRSDA